MRLVFIGTGYVGLVSGTCFAELGFDVTCVDIDAAKIAALQRGNIPIYEPGLDALVAVNVRVGRLRFSTDLAQSVRAADVVFIAVGTPSLSDSKGVDLSYVFAAARQVAPLLAENALLVIKSTVPPGTCGEIAKFVENVVSNPEFLREGMAIADFMRPDRIVIGAGAQNPAALQVMQQLYAKINAPVLCTTLEAAELIKYAANSFLAMKIAFINEIADICEKIGADVQQVAKGIGLDQRIGKYFLQPGPGFGGSCFPKDIQGLQEFSKTILAPSQLVQAVINANADRIQNCVKKIIAYCDGELRGKRLAVLGLAFKGNTDDIRESPAIYIIEQLLAHGALIKAYDPAAMPNAQRHFLGTEALQYAENIEECVAGSDALVIATEWPQFKELAPATIISKMSTPIIIDLRNLYQADYFADTGIKYISVGRQAHV